MGSLALNLLAFFMFAIYAAGFFAIIHFAVPLAIRHERR
jgi:hypothetical protein